MKFASQRDLELSNFSRGIEIKAGRIAYLEESGSARVNPYANILHKRFTVPLAEKIEAVQSATGAAARSTQYTLLHAIDATAAAWHTVRALLDLMLQKADLADNSTSLFRAVGTQLHYEYVFTALHDASPDMYRALLTEFNDNNAGDAHRYVAGTIHGRNRGVEFKQWTAPHKLQIGAWLCEQLADLGMLLIHRYTEEVRGKPKTRIAVLLHPDVIRLISQVRDASVLLRPFTCPAIELPKPWTSNTDGGYHTDEMRRTLGTLVRAPRQASSHYDGMRAPQVWSAANVLQCTKWAVNRRLMRTLAGVVKRFNVSEVVSAVPPPAPVKPAFLDSGIKKSEMSEEQHSQFVAWRAEVTDWHLIVKRLGQKVGRMAYSMRTGKEFSAYPAIYFPYFADFRGRMYASAGGLNPQGSDLQRGLLQFARGMPLDSADAVRWFRIHGASRFGFDKATLTAREEWSLEHEEQIVAFGSNPGQNPGWTEANKPIQFLAWCQEYVQWRRDPTGFLSHLPVGLDGSANGLQNFSAMLRDEVGGKAVNLTRSALPQDLYSDVAAKLQSRLAARREEDPVLETFRLLWVQHGINRGIVKRSVMTLPYGSTQYSMALFIQKDYLEHGNAPEFLPGQHGPAARFLAKHLWVSIGEVVIKAREAMAWLRDTAARVIAAGEPCISWETPSGFQPQQYYMNQDEIRVRAKLFGGTSKIRLRVDSGSASKRRHQNGLPPNFIHSMDSAHMVRTINAAAAKGLRDFQAVHDDFGTHARMTPLLFRTIREEFVRMYEQSNPLEELAARYAHIGLAPLPAPGTLNIRDTLDSDFFFS